MLVVSVLAFFISLNVLAIENEADHTGPDLIENNSQSRMEVEDIWINYAKSKGGVTWSESTEYPEYQKVKEGDTIMIQDKRGPCLMEFFHGRWRRANDVRRWDESVNAYGGCPYVFD